MAAGSTLQQEHVSALMADYCGLASQNVPIEDSGSDIRLIGRLSN